MESGKRKIRCSRQPLWTDELYNKMAEATRTDANEYGLHFIAV